MERKGKWRVAREGKGVKGEDRRTKNCKMGLWEERGSG